MSRHGNLWFIVAEVSRDRWATVAETTREADARLIAAAPELLTTLNALVDLLNQDLDPEQCAAWDAAVAAIAKAEGR